jgi:hypothetical protein
MAAKQRIETHGRNTGHNGKYGKADDQGREFVIQLWFATADHKEHEEHSRKAERNGKAGSEQNPGNYGEWTHRYDRFTAAAASRWLLKFAKCTLDRQALGI